jgi:hypothetical protein
MCGRYTETKTLDDLAKRIPFVHAGFFFTPRYNIAPTQKDHGDPDTENPKVAIGILFFSIRHPSGLKCVEFCLQHCAKEDLL